MDFFQISRRVQFMCFILSLFLPNRLPVTQVTSLFHRHLPVTQVTSLFHHHLPVTQVTSLFHHPLNLHSLTHLPPSHIHWPIPCFPFTHLLIQSLIRWSLQFPVIHPSNVLLSHSLSHPPTCSFIQSLTHSFTFIHSFIHWTTTHSPLTNLLTQLLTFWPIQPPSIHSPNLLLAQSVGQSVIPFIHTSIHPSIQPSFYPVTYVLIHWPNQPSLTHPLSQLPIYPTEPTTHTVSHCSYVCCTVKLYVSWVLNMNYRP